MKNTPEEEYAIYKKKVNEGRIKRISMGRFETFKEEIDVNETLGGSFRKVKYEMKIIYNCSASPTYLML